MKTVDIKERICPSCRLTFEPAVEACPSDGRRLLEIELGDRTGEVIDDRLTLLGELGRGGMGVVYRALQHTMCREVAVKLLDPDEQNEPEAVSRFMREAREASRLSHPNVITLFDFGRTSAGELYLVMELLRGSSLAEVLELEAPLELPRAVAIGLQICDALAAAHARQIVHRDLKPENILLLRSAALDGEFVKVIDFGIAKTRPFRGESSVTSSEVIYGTPLYMAPEQILGEEIDGRADLYALGLLLFQMVTGRLPFICSSVGAILVSHLRDPPPAPGSLRADLPEGLDRLISGALSKEAAERPPTAMAFKAELQAALRTPGGEGRDERSTMPPAGSSGLETNLTVQASTFVGRVEDVAALHRALGRGGRLITIHGPGGMGKTRLAVEYGLRQVDDFLDGGGGVWFCDLTEAETSDDICAAVARVLHVPLVAGDDDPVVQVSHAIAARGRVLLIVDNFEQVIDHGAATVGRWLELAPEARFLVTSRELLALPGEEVFELAPLALPDGGAEAISSEAVQLFVERARSTRPSFRVSSEAEAAVVQIVRQLDGMPLAIELAAARMAILTPAQLLDRLRTRFDLLRRRRGGPGRQATLRAAIDWSWELLAPWEQTALAQLSVFAGGFTADAAEGVIDLSHHPEAPWVLDVVQALGDKSLVRTSVSPEFPGELRLGLYESIRQYAAERLAELGQVVGTEARHTGWFLEVCGGWAEGVGGRESVRLRALLSMEMENLAAVLRRARQRATAPAERRAAATEALRAVLAMDPVLRTRGPFGLHLAWLEAAIAGADAEGVDRRLLARGLLARGEVRRTRKRSSESGEDFERALEISRALGDKKLEGQALFGLANLSHGQGRVEASVQLFEQALAVQREAGDRSGEGNTLAVLGAISIWVNRLDQARIRLEAALRCLRQAGDSRFEGFVLVGLGALHFELGETAAARGYVEQALGVLEAAGEQRFQGEALMYLAELDWVEGALAVARQSIEQALAISREVGDMVYEARYQALGAAIDACDGRLELAGQAFDLAAALARDAGSSLVELTVDLLRGQLDLARARVETEQGDHEAAARLRQRASDRRIPAITPGPSDEAHPEGAPAPREICDEVRFALKMLERALERAG